MTTANIRCQASSSVYVRKPMDRWLRPRSKAIVSPALFLAISTALLTPFARARPASDSHRLGVTGMPDPSVGSLLVVYYERYLKEQDIEAFRQQVSSRYTEGTLARLVDAPDIQARRGTLLALGLFGSYSVNGAVAKALRDPDPTVRRLADIALWSIWFRADTPDHNMMLEQVRAFNGKQRYEEAILQASRLIERSPQFAEAYNQRAIAEFFLGRFKESAEDCERVLERNPYHIGALSGLANCQLRLARMDAALKTLRRAAKLQPYNTDLRQWIVSIETGEP